MFRHRSPSLSPTDKAWLQGAAVNAVHNVGFDAAGWESSTWVLHAMFEVAVETDLTHDDVLRRRLAEGLEEPLIVGEVNLDEVGVNSGVALGLSEPPPSPWRRLSWRELARRQGLEWPPPDLCWPARWFGFRSWPLNIEPPCHGSLDRTSLDTLTACLAARSRRGPRSRCVSYHEPTAWFGKDPAVIESRLGELPLFGSGDQLFSASNVWPTDRTWFVYTDYDLSATKVSGRADLIAEIAQHPDLETVNFEDDTTR